jgi:hypothetical protein
MREHVYNLIEEEEEEEFISMNYPWARTLQFKECINIEYDISYRLLQSLM